MIQIIKNISSVAHYESKLLTRSWFFKIFALLITALLGFFALKTDMNSRIGYSLKSYNIVAYFTIHTLNIFQSLVIIFLSADFLKRDKQLDTSEVFYVKPLSNAEYLLGKIWGTLKSFFILDVILLLLLFFASKYISKIDTSIWEFVMYYAIIVIPTMIFMVGTSTGLMLIIGNQSLTFVALLALSALSLFYVGDIYHNIFDMYAFEMPLYKSNIVGYGNLDYIINHRLIYLTCGIGFIFLSIYLFKRLAGSTKTRPFWLFLGVLTLCGTTYLGVEYFNKSTAEVEAGKNAIATNNKYIDTPKILVKNYNLDVKQIEGSISSKVEIDGKMENSGSEAVFSLNSGMKVDSVIAKDGSPLNFDRDGHILVVKLGKEYKKDEKIAFSVDYKGSVNEDEMYPDLCEDKAKKSDIINYLFLQKELKSSFSNPKWILYTPESRWYPMSGITYTDSVSNWETKYLSNFKMKVTPQDSLMAASEGESKILDDSISYSFKSTTPLRSISLSISDFVKFETTAKKKGKKVKLAAYIHKSNIGKYDFLKDIADTIPDLLSGTIELIERNIKVEYDLDRLTIVDAPATYTSYQRAGSNVQDAMYSEIAFFPAIGVYNFNFKLSYEQNAWAMDKGWYRPKVSKKQIKLNLFKYIGYEFTRTNSGITINQTKGGKTEMNVKANPHNIETMLFNNKFNIYSKQFSWCNQVVEKTVTKNPEAWEHELERSANGLSNAEKVTQLLKTKSIDECLKDKEVSYLNSNIIEALRNQLFAKVRSTMGSDNFKNYLDSLLDKSKFSNFSFDSFLDSLTTRSGVDMNEQLELLKTKIELPQFNIGELKFERYRDLKKIINVYELTVSNVSKHDGFIEINYFCNTPEVDVVEIKAGETKRIVKHCDVYIWYLNINTLNSETLPSVDIKRPAPTKEFAKELKPEGEFIVDNYSDIDENEIIVDNEDEELFSVTKSSKTGLFNNWIDKSIEKEFKYKGVFGRVPYSWTPFIDKMHYGRAIKSAYLIKGGGDGSQKATWRVPTKGEGRYEVYIAATFPYEVMHSFKFKNNRGKPIYDVELDIDGKSEKIEVNLKEEINRRSSQYTWIWLGDFNIKSDTMTVSLSNKTDLHSVKADAVKIVRIGDLR